MRRTGIIAIISCVLFMGATGWAAIPQTLHYSGKLDTAGGAFTGTIDIKFTLYNNLDVIDGYWSEHQAVAVTNGRFHVELGPLSAADVDVAALHLGVAVGADDEMDKVAIASVPYALRASEAGNALTVGGQAVTDFAPAVHSHGLADLEHPGCTAGQVLSSDGSGWACGDDGKLTEAEVEDYIENDSISLADGSRIGGVPVSNKGTSVSLAIGQSAGSNMTGNYNVLMGSAAGSGIADGSSNTYLGYGAGRFQTGDKNVSVGSMAMYGSHEGEGSTGDFNTVMGYDAGRNVTSGNGGVYIGYTAGKDVTEGGQNVFLGNGAGYALSTSDQSVGVGNNAARCQTGGYNTAVGGNSLYGTCGTSTGEYNAGLGYYSGRDLTSGSNNTFIGVWAGENVKEGSGNVFLGYMAGRSELGSNQLYIDNSGTNEPLIKGDFAANTLTVHGNLGIGTVTPQGLLDLGSGTMGRGLTWGGSSGVSQYASVFTTYSSGSLTMAFGYKGKYGVNGWAYSYAEQSRSAISLYPGSIRFFADPTSTQTVGDNATPTERMRITDAGNVGIGTASPSVALEVNGTVKADSIKFADGTEQTTAAGGVGVEGSVMRLQKGANQGGAPSSCPAGWSEADYQSINTANYTNNTRTCYRNDVTCHVLYLQKGANQGGAPSSCPAGWSEADYQSINTANYTNNTRTCYRCP